MTTTAKKAAAPKAAAKTETPSTWELLTAPFDADWIEKLPRNLQKSDTNKGRCEAGSYYSADGHGCGGWHARSIHLDYVGHAGITMRLNDVLGPQGWDFQPFALDPAGLPIIGRDVFYAALTITVPGEDPVTKWDLAANFGGPQEAFGDALRRCAMRFGIGTYLWSKSDHALHLAQAQDVPPEAPPVQENQNQAPSMTTAQVALQQDLGVLPVEQQQQVRDWWQENNVPALASLSDDQVAQVRDVWKHLLEPQDPQTAH